MKLYLIHWQDIFFFILLNQIELHFKNVDIDFRTPRSKRDAADTNDGSGVSETEYDYYYDDDDNE